MTTVKGEQTYDDLCAAVAFFAEPEHREGLPLDRFFEPAHITCWVRDDEHAESVFAELSGRVLAEGGTVLHRSHEGTMQHTATLPFGSGRISYRVLWVEKGVSADADAVAD